jgi:glycine/sarcosine N-methyltransferase
MDDGVRTFYDELTVDYHLLFADWRTSMERQSAALDRLIREALGPGQKDVLDCACGIGTQAIGLALRGYQVQASDLSPKAIARARREAEDAGVAIAFDVADLRMLAEQVSGEFDVVLACDNALPHLLDDADLRRAVANMAAKLPPGGLLLASIRDYNALARERPRTEGPRVLDGPDGRRITFQVWDWAEDGRHYAVHQFIVRQDGERWHTRHFATAYRALLRGDLETALRATNLRDITWHEPAESGFFQPIVTARKT